MEEYLNEKEQWERAARLAARAGVPGSLAGVAVALAVFGGWRYWQKRTEQRALAAAARYEQVVDAFSATMSTAASRLADELVKEYPSTRPTPIRRIWRRRASRSRTSNSSRPPRGCGRCWQPRSDPELALVARLRLARVQLAQGKPDRGAQDARRRQAGRLRGALCARCAAMRCSPRAIATARSRTTARRATAAPTTRRRRAARSEDRRAGALVSTPRLRATEPGCAGRCPGAWRCAPVLGVRVLPQQGTKKKAEKPAVLVPFANRIELQARLVGQGVAVRGRDCASGSGLAVDGERVFAASHKGDVEAFDLQERPAAVAVASCKAPLVRRSGRRRSGWWSSAVPRAR